MTMIENSDGTITCPECNETYVRDRPEDVFDSIRQGKRCQVCLGSIWEWVRFN